jgi:hypothetical protein
MFLKASQKLFGNNIIRKRMAKNKKGQKFRNCGNEVQQDQQLHPQKTPSTNSDGVFYH